MSLEGAEFSSFIKLYSRKWVYWRDHETVKRKKNEQRLTVSTLGTDLFVKKKKKKFNKSYKGPQEVSD